MSAAALRAEAREHLRLAQEKLAQADALDGAPDARPATVWISTGRAQQIIRANSPSSVYRVIDKHPEIARLVNRRWQIDEEKFLAAIGRGESGEASGESGECNPAFAMR